jgi:hypothetical protein
MIQFGGKPKKTSSDTKRHFTVVMGNKEHGLYVSSTPSSAAKKAVTKLCASNKSKKVEFHIREITQGSKKKTYGSYVGYIDKLKKPIELKGRIIRYKPVAKLSGKESKKMRGGGGSPKAAGPAVNSFNFINNEPSAPNFNNINVNRKKISNKNDWKTPRPMFVIETVEDFRRKKFDPLDLVMDRIKFGTPNTNHMLFDYKLAIPEGSQDRKRISFKFRKDITEEKLYEFLRDEQKKRKIMQKFVDLGIAHEATIFLDIPYIYEGNPEPIVERVEYLKYFPPEHLASQEIPEQVDYAMMDDMRHGFSRTIRTKEDILEYFRIKGITNKKQQNTIIKHYEEYRGKPLT